MEKLSSAQIRKMYLDFFKSKGHTVMPSASLVPHDDPTLLWINSGVATMKKFFDGSVVPKNPRITSSQKSIRTNDIENVGHTARHHTLFEMLGNFSVGDYFKEEAITWAWELLTSPQWFAMDPTRLYVTVYPKDTEAKRIWHEVAQVPQDHIYEVDDNFWDIGEGPSGPDSEIFYDRGQEFNNLPEDDPESYPGGENERYLEIWNIVFSEFNHKPDGTYAPLPHKNIDTGMGLERVVSVFQNARTNFETDLFLPLINETAKISGQAKYGDSAATDVSFKVTADHIRAVTFAIGDGALPSNEGRGYVIRRLIRRAVMHGQKLGIEQAFLYRLVPLVGKIMESYYPEVLQQADYIAKVVKMEEDRFNETLKDGLQLLNEMIADAKQEQLQEISGKVAFKLYDTYGFPVELTKEYALEQGLTVAENEFDAEMQKQKERARKARGNAKSMGVQSGLLTDITTPSEYVGYQTLTTQSVLKEIICDEHLVNEVQAGTALLIFDKTPFYAEMGGQVADRGVIKSAQGEVVARVIDVQHAPKGQNMHTVEVLQPLKVDQTYTLAVEREFHDKVRKNHTATHLLDQALRDVLGSHTHQAGSLVEPTYLRFDFTNLGSVTAADLAKVEQIVNAQIWQNLKVETIETTLEEAKKLGAIALFTEKYGERVRVVKIGNYSTEFCGGNHVDQTGDLGLFKIVSESGVGAGVRRIEAVTSKEAYEYLEGHSQLLQETAAGLKVAQLKEVPHRVGLLQQEIKQLEQKVSTLEAKVASQQAAAIFAQNEKIGKWTLIKAQVKVAGMDQLRQLADQWKAKAASDVLVLATAVSKDKVNLIVGVSPQALKAGLKAGALIKAIAPKVGGGGGGRPDLAQAGGKNPEGITAALAAAVTWMQQLD
ncbi:alanine--tRNA ligase [Liquorilactobacillus satsumensis]|nr:alanine--tRNA ligase [Liquorilactobacillus satsumensis]